MWFLCSFTTNHEVETGIPDKKLTNLDVLSILTSFWCLNIHIFASTFLAIPDFNTLNLRVFSTSHMDCILIWLLYKYFGVIRKSQIFICFSLIFMNTFSDALADSSICILFLDDMLLLGYSYIIQISFTIHISILNFLIIIK